MLRLNLHANKWVISSVSLWFGFSAQLLNCLIRQNLCKKLGLSLHEPLQLTVIDWETCQSSWIYPPISLNMFVSTWLLSSENILKNKIYFKNTETLLHSNISRCFDCCSSLFTYCQKSILSTSDWTEISCQAFYQSHVKPSSFLKLAPSMFQNWF